MESFDSSWETCHAGEHGRQIHGNRLEHLDLPISSYNARQGRSCARQCSFSWLSETYLQVAILRYQARLRIRRRGSRSEAYDDRTNWLLYVLNMPSLTSLQSERKNKKSGAAESHAKIAEKLLAAQMRREAVNHAQR